jgi:hypothetical protein
MGRGPSISALSRTVYVAVNVVFSVGPYPFVITNPGCKSSMRAADSCGTTSPPVRSHRSPASAFGRDWAISRNRLAVNQATEIPPLGEERFECADRRKFRGKDLQRRAGEQGYPDLERRRVESQRRHSQNTVTGPRAEFSRERESGDRPMRNDDALRFAGGSGRERDVRRAVWIVRPEWPGQRPGVRVGVLSGAPGVDAGELAQGGMIGRGRIDHRGGGRQLADHPFCPGLRCVVVESRVRGAEADDREQRHHLADGSPGCDEHRVTGSDPSPPQGVGVVIGSVRELLVGQLNARVTYRDPLWMATHLVQEQGFDVDRGHVGAGQGIEDPAAFGRDAAHVPEGAVEGRQLVHRGGDIGDEPVRYLRDFSDEAGLARPQISVVGSDDEVHVATVRAIVCSRASGCVDRSKKVVDDHFVLDLEPDHPHGIDALRTPVGDRDRDFAHRCPPVHGYRERRHHQRRAVIGTG